MVLTLNACMSERSDVLCIFALTLAASSDVPSLASTVACSQSMSSVMGVCSCSLVGRLINKTASHYYCKNVTPCLTVLQH